MKLSTIGALGLGIGVGSLIASDQVNNPLRDASLTQEPTFSIGSSRYGLTLKHVFNSPNAQEVRWIENSNTLYGIRRELNEQNTGYTDTLYLMKSDGSINTISFGEIPYRSARNPSPSETRFPDYSIAGTSQDNSFYVLHRSPSVTIDGVTTSLDGFKIASSPDGYLFLINTEKKTATLISHLKPATDGNRLVVATTLNKNGEPLTATSMPQNQKFPDYNRHPGVGNIFIFGSTLPNTFQIPAPGNLPSKLSAPLTPQQFYFWSPESSAPQTTNSMRFNPNSPEVVNSSSGFIQSRYLDGLSPRDITASTNTSGIAPIDTSIAMFNKTEGTVAVYTVKSKP